MTEQKTENIEKTVVETTKVKGRVKTPEQVALGERFLALETWEDFERDIHQFTGQECGLELTFLFMLQSNPSKRVDLDYLVTQAAITGQTLSAYLKSACASAGVHTIKLLVNGQYTKTARFRLHVNESDITVPVAAGSVKQAALPANGLNDLQGLASILTALKPDPPPPAPDNTALILQVMQNQRDDMRSILETFKDEIKELKDNSMTTQDVVDNMRELSALQKEFSPSSTSVTNAFQKLDKDKKEEVNDVISLTKYAIDTLVKPVANLKKDLPKAAVSENQTPEDLVEWSRENIIRSLAAASLTVEQIIDEVISLIIVARKTKNLHLIPELTRNDYNLEAAITDLLNNCQSEDYRLQVLQSIQDHPQYDLIKLLNLNPNGQHPQNPTVNGAETGSEIKFA